MIRVCLGELHFLSATLEPITVVGTNCSLLVNWRVWMWNELGDDEQQEQEQPCVIIGDDRRNKLNCAPKLDSFLENP